MPATVNPAVIYAVFGFYIIASLFAYEQWGLRLGGVLALPYLVVYSMFDLGVLLLFGVSAAVTFVIGEAVHRTTLIYGRRMLVAYLLISLVVSAIVNQFIGVSNSGVFLPILPGLFAYNLHREGEPVYRSVVFAAAVGMSIIVGSVILSLVPGSGVRPGDPTPLRHRTISETSWSR